MEAVLLKTRLLASPPKHLHVLSAGIVPAVHVSSTSGYLWLRHSPTGVHGGFLRAAKLFLMCMNVRMNSTISSLAKRQVL
jgi:hypothetical protein